MRFEPLLCLPTAWTSVLDSQARGRASSSERFAVHLFEGPVSVFDMDRLQTVGDQWTREHGGQRVELVVVLPSNTRMSHEERVHMARLIKHGEAHRTASATVILAEGMLASMQRSMLTGLMMIAPAPHPAKVFGLLAPALEFLFPHIAALSTLGKRARGRASTVGLQRELLLVALEQHVADFKARPDRPVLSASQRP